MKLRQNNNIHPHTGAPPPPPTHTHTHIHCHSMSHLGGNDSWTSSIKTDAVTRRSRNTQTNTQSMTYLKMDCVLAKLRICPRTTPIPRSSDAFNCNRKTRDARHNNHNTWYKSPEPRVRRVCNCDLCSIGQPQYACCLHYIIQLQPHALRENRRHTLPVAKIYLRAELKFMRRQFGDCAGTCTGTNQHASVQNGCISSVNRGRRRASTPPDARN